MLIYSVLPKYLIVVSWQSARRWLSHKPNGRLPLLSTRPRLPSQLNSITPPLASTKLCCLVTEVHRCK